MTKSGRNQRICQHGKNQKSTANKKLLGKHRKKAKQIILQRSWTCATKQTELDKKFQTSKGRFVLRGDAAKDDSGSYAVFTEQGSSESHMTVATILGVIPGCARQTNDAITGLHSSENGRHSEIIGMTRIRVRHHLDSSTTIPPSKVMGQNSRPNGTT